jgi:hypothetical protein
MSFIRGWLRSFRGTSRKPAGRVARPLRVDELEPRTLLAAHSLATAELLPLSPGTISGTLGAAPDFYAIRPAADGWLAALVHAAGAGTRLSLLSSDGQLLAQNDGQSRADLDSLIDVPLKASPGGTTYYLEVEPLGGGAGGYSLVTSYMVPTAPGQPLPAGLTPCGITTADFNGDGSIDLAVTNSYTGTVTVSLGAGDGTFLPGQQFDAGPGAGAVVAGDFNGDGVPDLAVCNVFAGTVSVLTGNGDGTFQPPVQFGTGGIGPVALVAGDFTGQGNLDLAVVNRDSNSLGVLMNDGEGQFTLAGAYAVGAGPAGVVTGDFNGDGCLDLAVANSGSDSVSVLLGNGDGTFQAAASCPVGGRPVALAAGDFNGDGLLDLAVANCGSGTVSILLGNGGGSFTVTLQIAVGDCPVALAAGDFNNDGITDLAVLNAGSGDVSILLGDGLGGFTRQAPMTAGDHVAGLAVDAVDGTGQLDVLAANRSGDVLALCGTGDGTFQLSPGAPSHKGNKRHFVFFGPPHQPGPRQGPATPSPTPVPHSEFTAVSGTALGVVATLLVGAAEAQPVGGRPALMQAAAQAVPAEAAISEPAAGEATFASAGAQSAGVVGASLDVVSEPGEPDSLWVTAREAGLAAFLLGADELPFERRLGNLASAMTEGAREPALWDWLGAREPSPSPDLPTNLDETGRRSADQGAPVAGGEQDSPVPDESAPDVAAARGRGADRAGAEATPERPALSALAVYLGSGLLVTTAGPDRRRKR